MKKVEVGKRLYSVASMDEYTDFPDLFIPKFTAIENPAAGVVLPIKGKNSEPDEPGVQYQEGAMVCYVDKPTNPEEYSTDRIIDYSNPKSIGDIIKNNQLIKDLQQDIMATPDNVLNLIIGDNDTPEMKALKGAINSKCVDKRQYEDRFPQYQNDMRLLKGNSITLAKMKSIAEAFDISITMTLSDASSDIPNPMGKEFSINITEGGAE